MQMDPLDYIIYIEEDQTCNLCIDDNGSDPYWLLGDSFLRGFYTVHDHAEKRFGFAPHSLSTKKSPYRGKIPSKELSGILKTWEIVVIAISSVVFVVVVFLIVWFLILKKTISG